MGDIVELLNEAHNRHLFVLIIAGLDLVRFISLAQFEGAAFVSDSPAHVAVCPQRNLLLEVGMHFGPVLPILDEVLFLVELLVQLRQFCIVELVIVVDLTFTGHLCEFLEVVAVELNLHLVVADGCLQLKARLLQQFVLLALRLQVPLNSGDIRLESTVFIGEFGHNCLEFVNFHQRVCWLYHREFVALVASQLLIKKQVVADCVLLFSGVTQGTSIGLPIILVLECPFALEKLGFDIAKLLLPLKDECLKMGIFDVEPADQQLQLVVFVKAQQIEPIGVDIIMLFFRGYLLLQLTDHAFVGLTLPSQLQYLLLVTAQDLFEFIVVLADQLALHQHIT